MIITREHQETLLAKYNETERTTPEYLAFIQGMIATLELVDKLI